MAENDKTKPVAEPKAALAMTSRGLEPVDIEGTYRFANVISKSDFATPMYKNNEANCMILLDLQARMGVPWMMLMQHVYIVHERPALDSTLSTALVNRSGQFVDPLEYEVEGKDVRDKDYRVRAYATRTSTGKVLYGPWIDWQLVRGEGWDAKAGSKWKSMPDQMFHYRAASWFQRRFCPELTMGMMEVNEAEDAGRIIVESKVVDDPPKKTAERIKAKFEPEAKQEPEAPKEEPETAKPDLTKAKAEKEQAKLAAAEAKAKAKAEKEKPAPKPEPEVKPEPEPKEEVQPDKWTCLRCDRKLKDKPEDVTAGGTCAHCFGQIVELS